MIDPKSTNKSDDRDLDDIVDSCLFDGVSPFAVLGTPTVANSLLTEEQDFGLDFGADDLF